MKIAVDVRTMGSRPSGIGMYTYNFLCELAKKPQVELVLISDVDTSEQMMSMRQLNIPVYLYGKQVFRSAEVFRYFDFVKKTLIELQPDIFWEPNNLLPKKMIGFKGKTILTVHDIFPITTPQYFGRVYQIYFRMMLQKSLKMVDAILYDSIFSKEEVEKYFAFVKKKAHFLSYVIIKPHNKGKIGTSVEVNAMTDNVSPYFLYVGNVEQRKGSDLLLKAFERYCKEGGKYRLVLGGGIKGIGMEEILNQAKEHNVQIEYRGYLSDEDKDRVIRGCHTFLFPSKAEGFGMPIIEVMQYGKPVLARELPIFKELIGDCISYFKISHSETEEIEDFVKKMHEAEAGKMAVDEAAYEEVLERYQSDKLGEKLLAFMRDL